MSSSTIAKAATLKPEIRLAQAVSEFEASLSGKDKATLRYYRSQALNKPIDTSDVMRLTAEIDLRAVQQNGGGQCFGPRMTNILQAVQQYAALGDVIVGGSQNIIACGVWSLLRLTLLVSSLSVIRPLRPD
jgi:ankyrin repeat domain-containing protein 50